MEDARGEGGAGGGDGYEHSADGGDDAGGGDYACSDWANQLWGTLADRNTIVAAFDIESTTSIYSGLLRMADLVAMQPNLNIPLFLVAPEERREKVFAEVNQPTFSRLDPRLAEICRYISFDDLRERLAQVKDFVRYLKPDFLEDLSKACDLEQE